MAQMNMIQALNSAMDVMMARDPSVVVMGEDVGYFGGVFRVTDGLQRKYGEHRVLDSPIAEGGIVATAIGMAVNGLKPVAEIQFADYIYPAVDQIASELARIRYRSAGDFTAPVVVRAPCGGGIRGGQTHSQSPEAIFAHICGVKVVMPEQPVRREGPADRGDRRRRPDHLLRAQAHLQRTVRRRSQQARGAVEHARERRGARGSLQGADRQVRDRAARRAGHHRHLRHDGLRVRGRGEEARHRRRDHRRAHDVAARHRSDLQFRQEDRPLRDRARGHALLAVSAPSCPPASRKNASGISSRRSSASPAGTLRIRMRSNGSIFPARPASPSRCAPPWASERKHEPLRFQDAGSRRRHGFRGSRRLARETRRSRAGRPGDVRGHDGKGRGGNARARHGPHPLHHRRARRHGGGGVGARGVRHRRDFRRRRCRARRENTRTRAGRAADAATPRRRMSAPKGAQSDAPKGAPSEKRQVAAAATPAPDTNGTGTHKAGGGRIMASPASRRRAAEAGLDLSTVTGTGPSGRIEPGDIDSALASRRRAGRAALDERARECHARCAQRHRRGEDHRPAARDRGAPHGVGALDTAVLVRRGVRPHAARGVAQAPE